MVGNTYDSLIVGGSCCALAATGGQPGLTGNAALDHSTCFIGNWVYGGRQGESHQGQTYGSPYTINFSGNELYLYQPFNTNGDYPGAVVSVGSCTAANVCGNTLSNGPLGFLYGPGCANAIILANNFSNSTYRAIGYFDLPNLGNGTLQSASIFTNSLNEGVSFHAELDYAHSFGWFLNRNTYLNGTNVVSSPFCDPISSAVHISN